jgi:uncharacterized LabA/DUF88 family protein
MDRVAVFVDAGYLFAQGGVLLTGKQQHREYLALDVPTIVAALTAVVERCTQLPLLRIYWYDGMRGGKLSPEQTLVAEAANVKLRLGQVNSVGEQKGVDALIVTDLIELGRNRVIADAVVLSGDEDVRVGVQMAQQLGVRVHLLGIEPAKSNQSRSLAQEADTVTEWDKATVQSFLAFTPPPTPPAGKPTLEEELQALVNAQTLEKIVEIKEEFAASRRVHRDVDHLIMRIGRNQYGVETLEEREKIELRNKFMVLVRTRA